MRKYANYLVFLALVLIVVWLAVSHSLRIRGLVRDMASGDAARARTAANDLIASEQFGDAVTGESISVRIRCAAALAELGTPAAVRQAIAFLKDPDKPVVNAVVSALEQIGGRTDANIAELVKGLEDGDTGVRKATVEAMSATPGGIGPVPGMVPAIVKEMKANGTAREPAAEVLGSRLFVSGGSNRDAVPLLVQQLADADEGVRTGAAQALGYTGAADAVAPLVTAMHRDTAAVRRVSIGALALIAAPSAEPALTEAIRNPNDDDAAREQAATGLGHIATRTAITTLIAALDDDDLNLRSAAVTALSGATRPSGNVNAQVASQLVAALAAPSAATRAGAAAALGAARVPSATSALVACLRDSESSVRVSAATALGQPGNASAVPALVAALSDPSGPVESAAQASLTTVGAAADTALGVRASRGGAAAYWCAVALGRQGAEALPELSRLAGMRVPAARSAAAIGLGTVGGDQATTMLETLSRDPDADVAWVAGRQLARIRMSH